MTTSLKAFCSAATFGPAAAVRLGGETLTLAAVLLGAALVRLAYLAELWRSPLFLLNTLPGLDMATYLDIAQHLVRGQAPTGGALFQAPLYGVALAVLVRFGTSVALVTALQAVMGVVACALLVELGRRLGSRRLGLTAAALYAVYPLAWYYAGLLLSENVLVVLVLALTLASIGALAHGRARHWLLVGVLCGIATLCKANVLLALPALLGAAMLVRPRRVTWRGGTLAVLGCAALLAPAVLYNSLAAGRLEFVSSQGNHLWLAGNSTYSTGLYQLPCGAALAPWDGQFWLLQGRKLLLFFSNEEFGNNTYVGVFAAHLWLPSLLGFGVIGALGVLGLAVAVPRPRRLRCLTPSCRAATASAETAGLAENAAGRTPDEPFGGWLALLAVLVSYVVGIVTFVVVGRYRLPAAALLCLPAAALLLRPAALRSRCGVVACAMVLLLIVAANAELPPDVSVPFAHANAATVFAMAGDHAAEQQELALAHAARLDIQVRDPQACAALPSF